MSISDRDSSTLMMNSGCSLAWGHKQVAVEKGSVWSSAVRQTLQWRPIDTSQHQTGKSNRCLLFFFFFYSFFPFAPRLRFGIEQDGAANLGVSWLLSREVRVKCFSSTSWPFVSRHLWNLHRVRMSLCCCCCHGIQPKCLRHELNAGNWLNAGFHFDQSAWVMVLF